MIKKIIILLVLGGLGYVGYLVWNNLSTREKAVVTGKAGEVVDGAKDLADKAADKAGEVVTGAKNLADKAADKLTGVAKDGIKKIDDGEKAEKPSD